MRLIESLESQRAYLVKQRDNAIEIVGIPVKFRIPNEEVPIDSFGDLRKLSDVDYEEYVTSIIPQFTAYYTLLSAVSRDSEMDVPLESIASVSDHIPYGSEVDLYVNDGNGEKSLKTFIVTSNEVKMYSTINARMLRLVPKRHVN